MEPEELYYLQICEILRDIKERMFLAENLRLIEFPTPKVLAGNEISLGRCESMIRKLANEGAFELKIQYEGGFYVSVNDQQFDYVYQKYKELSDIRANSHQGHSESKDVEENFEWLDKFHWLDENRFYLDEGKIITFGAKSSDRLTIFKSLTAAKGKWVTVAEMAEKIKGTHHQVRTIIAQINSEKLKEIGMISIVPKFESNKTGSYKIELIPQDRN